MDSRKISVLVSVLCFAFFVTSCLAEIEVTVPDKDVNATVTIKLPYYAKITGDDVYVRSGPGTNHYRCGKLQKSNIVKVLEHRLVWSRIIPPKGSFSWISKQYITISNQNTKIGVVTGDNVRVYAGSPYIEPIHSEAIQLHLNKGDQVVLMNEEFGDYYKIIPPKGATLWVSTQFTQPTDYTPPKPAVVEPIIPDTNTRVKPIDIIEEKKAIVPTTISEDSERLKGFYDLHKQVKTEVEKPFDKQDYSKQKAALAKILATDPNDKAGQYAKFILSQIKRYEIAAKIDSLLKGQKQEFANIYKEIETKRAEKIASFKDLGQYAVVGKLKTSNIYGPQDVLLHYIVVDQAEKIICYSLPTDDATRIDLKKYIGKKVGLFGTIEPHPQTAGALVKFNAIEIIE